MEKEKIAREDYKEVKMAETITTPRSGQIIIVVGEFINSVYLYYNTRTFFNRYREHSGKKMLISRNYNARTMALVRVGIRCDLAMQYNNWCL